MAALWPLSRSKEYDINGDPIVGAKAYFYEIGTLTPQVVYADSDLSEARDQPVETDSYGRWPAVYLNPDPGHYRQRVLDADDVVLFDDDDIDVPLGADYQPPDSGETSVELLARTGDLKARYATGAHSGWVRAAGRTIGSATSGASERANEDCEDLFEHLWNTDANLSVSGGRGANAAADWAANKTIALPDLRDRVIIGLGDMGNSDANRIADSLTDDDNITLGATAGASTVTLTSSQIPAHTHTFSGTTSSNGSHNHDVSVRSGDTGPFDGAADGNGSVSGEFSTSTDGSHTHTYSGTTSSTGSGGSHTNIQPGMFATWYIKL